jgi:hypothetical protein
MNRIKAQMHDTPQLSVNKFSSHQMGMSSGTDSELNRRLNLSGSLSLSIGKQNGLAILGSTSNKKLKTDLRVQEPIIEDEYGF